MTGSCLLHPSLLSDSEKIDTIRHHFAAILQTLGLDLTDESLKDTPDRIARMYVKEIFSGLDPDNFPALSFFDAEGANDVIITKTSFTSFCEHHFVPMQGTAHIAYIPNKKLIGLSKIPRIVRYFAKRPQLQERLTKNIADTLIDALETDNVAVLTRATHFCVIARGVEDQESETITQCLSGRFLHDAAIRREFFENTCNRRLHDL